MGRVGVPGGCIRHEPLAQGLDTLRRGHGWQLFLSYPYSCCSMPPAPITARPPLPLLVCSSARRRYRGRHCKRHERAVQRQECQRLPGRLEGALLLLLLALPKHWRVDRTDAASTCPPSLPPLHR